MNFKNIISNGFYCITLSILSASPALCESTETAGSQLSTPGKLQGHVSIENLPQKDPVEIFCGKKHFTDQELVKKQKSSFVGGTVSKAKSLANFVCDLRGFDWSKEAADTILNTKIDPKNAEAREFLIQSNCDRQEYRKSILIMQIALNADNDTGKTQQSLDELSKLIGPQQAVATYKGITGLDCEGLDLNDRRLQLDFNQKQETIKRILEQTSKSDSVLLSATNRLSKYNHRGKLIQTTAKVVYSTMGVAAFTPTLVAPLAEATLLTFMMATGGPEQDKLLKEVYLAKILESRCSSLSEKAHLVVETMDVALITKNKRLLACAKILLKELTDEETASSIVGASALTK